MFRLRSALATAALTALSLTGMVLGAQAQDRALWLYDDGVSRVEGSFYGGEAIYGSCDGDCYDLDLAIYDSAGNLIGSDTASDAFPVVIAPYDGFFFVEVSMPECSHPSGCEVWVSSDQGF